MGRCCFVPFCNTGDNSKNRERGKLYGVPKDPKLLEKWRKQIIGTNKVLQPKHYICEKHFKNEDIIKAWSDGRNNILLKVCRLTKNAVPSIFPTPPLNTKTTKKIKKGIKMKNRKLINEGNSKFAKSAAVFLDHSYFKKDTSSNISSNGSVEAVNNKISSREQSDFVIANEVDTIIRSNITLLYGWSLSKIFDGYWFLLLSKFKMSNDNRPVAEKQILVYNNGEIKYIVYGNFIQPFGNLRSTISSINELQRSLQIFNQMNVCRGGLSTELYPNHENKYGYVDSFGIWRHKKCTVFIGDRCSICIYCQELKKKFRNNLNPTEKKTVVIQHCRKTIKSQNQRIRRLKKQITKLKTNINLNKILTAERLNELPQMLQLVIQQSLLRNQIGSQIDDKWLQMCSQIFNKNKQMYYFLKDNNVLPLPPDNTIILYDKSKEIELNENDFMLSVGAEMDITEDQLE